MKTSWLLYAALAIGVYVLIKNGALPFGENGEDYYTGGSIPIDTWSTAVSVRESGQAGGYI